VHQNRLRAHVARGVEQRDSIGDDTGRGVRVPWESHDALLQIDDDDRSAARLKNEFAHDIPLSFWAA
jgi:CYTH domain-containing protein